MYTDVLHVCLLLRRFSLGVVGFCSVYLSLFPVSFLFDLRGQERTEQMQAMLQQQVRRSLLDFSSSSSTNSNNLYEADDLSYPEERKAADREAWAALAREQLAATSERDSRRRLRTSYKEAGEMQQSQQHPHLQNHLGKDGRRHIHIPRVPKLPNMQVPNLARPPICQSLSVVAPRSFAL